MAQTVSMHICPGHGNHASGTDVNPPPLHRPVPKVWLRLARIPGSIEHLPELHVELLTDGA
ncbi:hypothetical protein [Streptomyces sp. A012304]|uniref:hypothetical protein n=1 Tax=Streptomyces sp. A012304 TaxID=375446 RepID=UPI0022327514|nr:hypothetical protein [Streptomyces sp. A012304]